MCITESDFFHPFVCDVVVGASFLCHSAQTISGYPHQFAQFTNISPSKNQFHNFHFDMKKHANTNPKWMLPIFQFPCSLDCHGCIKTSSQNWQPQENLCQNTACRREKLVHQSSPFFSDGCFGSCRNRSQSILPRCASVATRVQTFSN